jgi:AcrR family transcriptional regulator
VGARLKLTARKKPTQVRAKETVEAILEAATYILTKQGWQQFTTNRVAERAGVNIASVYQYFSSKEAIVAELHARHSARIRQLFPRLIGELRAQTELHGLLRVIVAAVIEEHRISPPLHRVLGDELPRSARPRERSESVESQWKEIIRPFLRGVADPDIAMFIASRALHAAVHEAAAERAEVLQSPLFEDELVALLDRYLNRPS